MPKHRVRKRKIDRALRKAPHQTVHRLARSIIAGIPGSTSLEPSGSPADRRLALPRARQRNMRVITLHRGQVESLRSDSSSAVCVFVASNSEVDSRNKKGQPKPTFFLRIVREGGEGTGTGAPSRETGPLSSWSASACQSRGLVNESRAPRSCHCASRERIRRRRRRSLEYTPLWSSLVIVTLCLDGRPSWEYLSDLVDVEAGPRDFRSGTGDTATVSIFVRCF